MRVFKLKAELTTGAFTHVLEERHASCSGASDAACEWARLKTSYTDGGQRNVELSFTITESEVPQYLMHVYDTRGGRIASMESDSDDVRHITPCRTTANLDVECLVTGKIVRYHGVASGGWRWQIASTPPA